MYLFLLSLLPHPISSPPPLSLSSSPTHPFSQIHRHGLGAVGARARGFKETSPFELHRASVVRYPVSGPYSPGGTLLTTHPYALYIYLFDLHLSFHQCLHLSSFPASHTTRLFMFLPHSLAFFPLLLLLLLLLLSFATHTRCFIYRSQVILPPRKHCQDYVRPPMTAMKWYVLY